MGRQSRELLEAALMGDTTRRRVTLPITLTAPIVAKGGGEAHPFGEMLLPFRLVSLSLTPSPLATAQDMQSIFGYCPADRNADYSLTAWGVSICQHAASDFHPWPTEPAETLRLAPVLSIPFALLRINPLTGQRGQRHDTDAALTAAGIKPHAPAVDFKPVPFLTERPTVIVHGPPITTSTNFRLDLIIEVD